MNLTRTKRGTMIHKRDCHYAGMGKPWFWAEGKSVQDIIATCEQFGYQTCLTCRPLPGTVIRKVKT